MCNIIDININRGGYFIVKLRKNNLVEKRNVLNELRANNMTLQELRFFSIYLSKINVRDVNSRIVRFPVADFQAIMELSSRIKIDYMKNVTANLLRQIVSIRDELTGGYSQFQLFKECTVNQDNNGEWYVEIDTHDKALPLMFEFKNRYFSYQLFNALRLRSSNQLRMYEILKQYEVVGSRVLSIEDLRGLLGIKDDEYPRYNDFKNRVLDACKHALKEHTDIKFTYSPYGKRGKGGKILSLVFWIEKNDAYIDQLTLDMFIDEQKNIEESDELSPYDERIEFFREAFDNEFSAKEVIVLYNLMIEKLPYEFIKDSRRCYQYLQRKYSYMNMRNEKEPVNNRFGYIKSIIGKDDI
jgi:plasmid replication initiation protein